MFKFVQSFYLKLLSKVQLCSKVIKEPFQEKLVSVVLTGTFMSHKVKVTYEVKNNCCLFERLFKVKKNGVFLFGISFFRYGDIYVFVLCK